MPKGLPRSMKRRSKSQEIRQIAVDTYAKAALPAVVDGAIIKVSDDVGGVCLAVGEAGVWKKLTLGATVS